MGEPVELTEWRGEESAALRAAVRSGHDTRRAAFSASIFGQNFPFKVVPVDVLDDAVLALADVAAETAATREVAVVAAVYGSSLLR